MLTLSYHRRNHNIHRRIHRPLSVLLVAVMALLLGGCGLGVRKPLATPTAIPTLAFPESNALNPNSEATPTTLPAQDAGHGNTAASESTEASTPEATATPEAATGRVFFVEPADHAVVPQTFTVVMGVEGLEVQPAGEVVPGAGHMHILIDTDFIPAGEVIPSDEHHLHFGDGSLEAELTLEPGEHVLRLQFADGAHRALEGEQYRDEITVTVE
ncbi:MAG: hypothetical protein KatS3mg050_1474 [Litorilinea sp.]|nr:MAG: hypothetical protein KatS3mg050_1474 [Litorilinea sp.]